MARVIGRPSLANAIGMLRAQQQDTNNDKVLSELESLRKDLAKNKSEVGNARQELATSNTRLQTAEKKITDNQKNLQDLLSSLKQLRTELEDLKKFQQACQQSITQNKGSVRSLLDEMTADIAAFTDRLTNIEGHRRAASEEMRELLATKAGHEHVYELQERLDELMLNIEKRLFTKNSISHVTDTPDRAARMLQGKHLKSVLYRGSLTPLDNMLKSCRSAEHETMLQPIAAEVSQQSSKTQTTQNFERSSESPRFVPPPGQQARSHDTRRSSSHSHPGSVGTDNSSSVGQVGELLGQQANHHQKADDFTCFPLTQLLNTNDQAIHASQPGPSTEPQPQQENVSTREEHRAVCKALYQLVSLEQEEPQSLGNYFNALATLARELPEKSEIESIYLRKFINGIKDDSERGFAIEWLEKSEWSLQDVRECVVLLSSALPKGKRLLPPELLVNLTQADDDADVPMPSVEDASDSTFTHVQQQQSESVTHQQPVHRFEAGKADHSDVDPRHDLSRLPFPPISSPFHPEKTRTSVETRHEEHETLKEILVKNSQPEKGHAPQRTTACNHRCKHRDSCGHKCCKIPHRTKKNNVIPATPRISPSRKDILAQASRQTSPLSELTRTPIPRKRLSRPAAAALASSILSKNPATPQPPSSPYSSVTDNTKRRKLHRIA